MRPGPLPLAAAFFVALGLGCDRMRAAEPGNAAALAAPPVVEVETARVRRGSIVQPLSAPGSVVARRESRIGTEITGRIERVFVAEGDRVEAGDPLFQIEREPYEYALRQAQAGLDLARAERGRIEVDVARARTLHAKQVLSQQEVDRLATALSVARARERQAVEAVALARRNLEQTRVTAPYAGSVARRLEDEGTTALVQPQTIVIVLQETAELEARAAIPESQLALIHLGDPVRLHVEGLAEPIETQVSAVSDTIDRATRTYLVKMWVPNPDHTLKAGVFAHVEILPRTKADVLLVPRVSVRTEDGRTRVLVVRDGRAQALPVQIGLVSEEEAEVLQGVDEGDTVIVGEAARTIAPGMPVRVVQRTDSPAS